MALVGTGAFGSETTDGAVLFLEAQSSVFMVNAGLRFGGGGQEFTAEANRHRGGT